MSHTFEEKTFGQLAYCYKCKQLLWGFVKQGVHCKECGHVYHNKCKDSATNCPSAVPTSFLDDDNKTDKNRDLGAQKFLHPLTKQARSEDVTMTPAIGSSSHSTTSTSHSTESSNQDSTLQHIRAIATSDKFQTILADAATTEGDPVNAYLANQAPLNPQVTAKNFTRFVSRCGPVFAFRDELFLLLSWENWMDTCVSLIVYCLVCIYPKLALFVPQAILVYFILSNHSKYKQQKHLPTKKDDNKKEKPVGERDKGKATSSKKLLDDKTAAEIPSLTFPFNISTLFQPASDESPEYLRNLQNIQNTMGEFSDIYDWFISYSDYFNWSSELETMRVLQAILVSTFLISFAVYVVSLNMVFLLLGLAVYGINTRFAKNMIRELKPYLIQSGKIQAEELKEWYVGLENKLQDQENLQEIAVYENQRWWPMRGYLHKMVENERSPWSDFTGRVYLPTITEIPVAKGYQWIETSEWKLDMTGPWVDDYLKIEIFASPDSGGWIYSDDNWKISSPQIEPIDDIEKEQNKKALTRRRRWVRECDKV